MQIRAAGLVLSGLTSLALVWGASSTAHAATVPDFSRASASVPAFDWPGAEAGSWFDPFVQLGSADDNARSIEPNVLGLPFDSEGDETLSDLPDTDSPDAADSVHPDGGSGDHGQPPKHGEHGTKPGHGEHGKPGHGEHGKPGHGEHGTKPGEDQDQNNNQNNNQNSNENNQDQGQAQDQDQSNIQDQDQNQAQDQDQTQAQDQHIVITLVQENKQNVVNTNVNNVHVSNEAKASNKENEKHGKGHLAPPTAAHPHKGELAHTGSDALVLIGSAVALLAAGAALLRLRRNWEH